MINKLIKVNRSPNTPFSIGDIFLLIRRYKMIEKTSIDTTNKMINRYINTAKSTPNISIPSILYPPSPEHLM